MRSPFAARPEARGQSPCNSCALRCRLGIVDRPRPPSIMSLMYIVFSSTLPPLFPRQASPLFLSSGYSSPFPVSSLINAFIRLARTASLPASIVVSSLRSEYRSYLLSRSLFFSSSTHRHFLPFHRSAIPFLFFSVFLSNDDVVQTLLKTLAISRRRTYEQLHFDVETSDGTNDGFLGCLSSGSRSFHDFLPAV